MNSIQVLHIGDVHYCDKFLPEVARCMTSVIQIAAARRPDLIIIPGDTFDHRLEQNSPAFFAALRAVRALSEVAPVFILQGTLSHDAPHAVEVFRHMESAFPVHVCTTIQQVVLGRDGRFSVVDPDWIPNAEADACVISALPSVNKGVVAASAGAENAGEAAGDAVAQLLIGWAPSHRRAAAAGVPTIFTSHGTVSGSRTEHGCVMAGLDYEFFTGTIFASQASASMLNHIHAHQAWREGERTIAYAGSVGRLHFGERDPKGVLLWTLDATGSTFEFIPTPARDLVDLEFTGPPDLVEVQRAVAALPEGGELRVRYAVDEEHRHSVDVDALKGLVGDRGKVEGRVLPVQRQRAAGIGKTASLHDKVRQWCDIAGADPAPLLERLDLLLAGDVDRVTPPAPDHEKAA